MRFARAAAVRSPVSPELILRPAFHVAELCWSLPMVRSIAFRLLEFRRGAAIFRTAEREIGSWRAFRKEFSTKLTAQAGGTEAASCTLPISEPQ